MMSLDVKYIKIDFLLPRRMCGPIEKCCCCFPAKVGVKFIGGILILVELVGVIYITVILSKNNKVPMEFKICMCYSIQIRHFQAFHEVLDTDLPGYSAYMTGAIMGFIILVGCNLLLIYGSAKNCRHSHLRVLKIPFYLTHRINTDTTSFPGWLSIWSLSSGL